MGQAIRDENKKMNKMKEIVKQQADSELCKAQLGLLTLLSRDILGKYLGASGSRSEQVIETFLLLLFFTDWSYRGARAPKNHK